MSEKSLTENLFINSGNQTFILESDSEEDEITELGESNEDSDVNQDAENLLVETNEGNKFEWVADDGQFKPKVFPFTPTHRGYQIKLEKNVSILDCFELFFPIEIAYQIAEETNSFYSESTLSKSSNPKRKKWNDIEVQEVYLFLALSLLMPQIQKLKVQDYWHADKALATPFFGQVMVRDRYCEIMRLLHFSKNDKKDENDTLYKIRMLITHFREVYKTMLYPFQNLCIDRSFLVQKNSNPHGFKFFCLYDCATGYVLDFIIHCDDKVSDVKLIDTDATVSDNIVLTLMQPYLDRGHTLYTNSLCTSPVLFNILHSRGTNACGVIRQSTRFMPDMKEKIKKRKVMSCASSNMLSLKWQGQTEVIMLSTCHTAEMTITASKKKVTGERKLEPKCIVDYNLNMLSADKTGMLRSTIESLRKSINWYKKVFFHLLDLTVVNAHVLYKLKTGEDISLASFQLSLVKQLVEKYYMDQPRVSYKVGYETDLFRLIARHFPNQLPKSDTNQKKMCRRCIVCTKHKLRKETSYCCLACNVPLCPVYCFERYHTLKDY